MASNMIAEAQADFAVNLLRETAAASPDVSVILSPISVAIALSMAYAGAMDGTKSELSQLLGKGASADKIHSHFGAMLQKISSANANYTLSTANRIYVQNNFDLLDSYKSILNDQYRGELQSVDFSKAVETAKLINDFAEEKTHGKIKDLIKPDSLDALTRLLLVNAIYFKGSWLSKFKENATKKEKFYIKDGEDKMVDMMHKKHSFYYTETSDAQVLGLPYQGDEVIMLVVLPKERFGLSGVLSNLNGSTLLALSSNRRKEEVVVSLPKFKVESTHQLVPLLSKLGLAKAFSSDANFSGISKGGELYISDVVQKAFIEVNEEGTEAAAASAATARMRSASPSYLQTFVADHPFALFITFNNKSEENAEDVLFQGIYQ